MQRGKNKIFDEKIKGKWYTSVRVSSFSCATDSLSVRRSRKFGGSASISGRVRSPLITVAYGCRDRLLVASSHNFVSCHLAGALNNRGSSCALSFDSSIWLQTLRFPSRTECRLVCTRLGLPSATFTHIWSTPVFIIQVGCNLADGVSWSLVWVRESFAFFSVSHQKSIIKSKCGCD